MNNPTRLAALVVWAAATLAVCQVPKSECFPLETLPRELQPQAERLLLKALDTEALYTIVGGMKPISSGWFSARFDVDRPDLAEIDRVRQITRAFRNGDEIVAGVQPFWRVFEGRRFVDGVFFHRPSVSEAIRRNAGYFAFYGISPASHPVEAVMAFEVDSTARRNRGYGYLFGYPKHAVDFFVESEESRRHSGKFVERDFLSIPVFEAPTSRFVYAVPKGHVPTAEDRALKERAAPILAYYQHLRPRFIGEGKPGVVALLREWFHDGRGGYSSAEAERKARAWANAAPLRKAG